MNMFSKWLNLVVLLVGLVSAATWAEDIDIFTGTTPSVDASLPNVIFVLDNTSNWARQSQQWPGGSQQGQSEVRAIKAALQNQVGKLNVGIVEFTTEADANKDGGYVRFDLQTLTDGSVDPDKNSLAVLDAVLQKIDDDINEPIEKRNSNTAYGNLMYDFYNYLDGGDQSFDGAGTPNLADEDAYEDKVSYSRFASPLDTGNACAKTYMIFIANPNSSGPSNDSVTNSGYLESLYRTAGSAVPNELAGGNAGDPIPWPEFTTTTTTGPATPFGNTTACYKKSGNVSAAEVCTAAENGGGGMCAGQTGCSCVSVNLSCGKNAGDTFKLELAGTSTTVVKPTGRVDATGGADFNLDDWTKFLRNYGVLFTGENVDGEELSERVSVTTFTIDVFNAQQNAETSALLYTAAKVGGGRYFQAKTEGQILDAINSAFNDILSVATSFAAVTLPLSAENRALSNNQVFIGLFRPSAGKEPRWFGNLKEYQLALDNGLPVLADARRTRAINPLTGFLRECAASFWTTDTGAYWEDLGIDPPPRGQCDVFELLSDWSDFPDGPYVEKGGVAQVTREGGARPIYTVGVGGLEAVGNAHSAALGGDTVLSFLSGDTAGFDEVMPDSGLKASVHGDVVHSRPLTINYGSGNISIFYGVNDGIYRAIDATDGSEKWAFIAPEHFDRVQRLYDNTPLVKYTGEVEDPGLDYLPKDYFFDGSTGQLLDYNDDGDLQTAYIYPTMRRGGRMIYGFDVTDPDAAPELLWRVGCPNLADNTNCTVGFNEIGQTWSTPMGGFVSSYNDGLDPATAKPIVVFGGGFDDCLNADAAAYPAACAGANGKGIYVLDGKTGTLLRKFATDAPVITDVGLLDVNFDGHIDFAYAADVAGNIYRVSFSTLGNVNPENAVAELAVADWEIVKIAATADNETRFYNSPTVAAIKGNIFITIGTGDRERPLQINYPYVEDVQNRFYALVDKPYLPIDPLVPRTVVDLDGATMVALTNSPLDPNEPPETFTLAKDGWYLDLPDTGEQVVNPAAIGGGKVFFNTLQPGGASRGLCTAPIGQGKGYAVDLFTPGYTEGEVIVGDGIPIAPVIVRVLIPPVWNCVDDCDEPPPPVDCKDGGCEIRTVCIGCLGMEPIEIIPDAPPIRRRAFFTEDTDR
jgi:hypothetical protein